MPHERPQRVSTVNDCVDQLLQRVGKKITLGLPLGLGKPLLFTNALYQRAKADPSIELHIVTALSLLPPAPSAGLEARFMTPIIERLYGAVPELDYARDVLNHDLPDNVKVSEFFFQVGSFLHHSEQQQHYICTNYTHAMRDLLALGINVIAQLVAPDDNPRATQQLSLSCNPDLSLDLFRHLRAAETVDQPIALIAECNPNLPFFGRDAAVPASTFDLILQNEASDYPLFAVPQEEISPADHLIGFYASSLIKDGGTLQVGIGSLGAALVYSICLRHQHNANWRELYQALDLAKHFPIATTAGGTEPFTKGLYGCSEMMVDGFIYLLEAGILTRNVYPDAELQEKINAGVIDPEHSDDERLQQGTVMHGGFYLGPNAFYEKLRQLSPQQRDRICMSSVNYINDLTNHRFGDQRLKVAQRVSGRFINSAIQCTLSGAVVSDGLDDGRVLSGVGGQYNFVAMAHELPDARSIITLRSTRTSGGKAKSTIVFSYGHCTIPRHLRDIVVTEYGIADLRGKSDEEVYLALIRIADARFQPELLEEAKKAGKIAADFCLPEAWQNNTPAAIERALQQFQKQGLFPAFPFGTELSDDEIELKQALEQLEQRTSTLPGKLCTLFKAVLFGSSHNEYSELLERMELQQTQGLKAWLDRRLLVVALKRAVALKQAGDSSRP
ncbi:acetyl-CoA hydrolase/transferase C-terminal domain-containing protein [Pseudidiomarina halophila]|uniref:Acetyl-CoA hydrolase n=1 Tax=Pseudidiomarina halophila TaxID=1449799 RepID=A0A432XVQ0_9GAMM|nr:acetyl-CoA hydrolase/transferase C-terminal domain-containing protein [Pseudidiomarina halophila]RUO52779.1 acetyl-CoA hydrolase [Pseudidiomarina halophila]